MTSEKKKPTKIVESESNAQKLRESVEWFSGKMEQKLKANTHKGGWGESELGWLFVRLKEEVEELHNAINDRVIPTPFFGVSHTEEEIIQECADVANFAMMIADKFGKQFGK